MKKRPLLMPNSSTSSECGRRRDVAEVGLVRGASAEQLASSELPIVYDHAVDVRRPAERLPRLLGVVPVRVPDDRRAERFLLHVLDVVRARRDERRVDALRRRSAGSSGSPRRTASSSGRGSPARLTFSLIRRASCPIAAVARARRRGTTTPGDCIFGSSARSIAAREVRRRHRRPSVNLKPCLTVKVYVLPSLDTFGKPAAASGRMRLPAAPSTIREAQQLQLRRVQDLPRVREVREARDRCSRSRSLLVDPQRPPAGVALARGLRLAARSRAQSPPRRAGQSRPPSWRPRTRTVPSCDSFQMASRRTPPAQGANASSRGIRRPGRGLLARG